MMDAKPADADEAVRELRSSEERLTALIENGLDFISLLSPDGTLLWESPSTVRPLGYPPGSFVGHNMFELIHPDDAGRARQTWARVMGEPAVSVDAEFRLRRSDGMWCWVEGAATNLLHNPSVRAIVVNYRDVTRRKQADEILRLQSAALNAAADAIVITGRDGVVEWSNAAFTTLSGYSRTEAYDKNLRDLVRSGVQDSAFYTQVWDTLLAGNVWRGEMINRRKDGSHYPEEQVITPVTDESGEITHFIAIKRDLTEKKQAANQVLQAQKMEVVGRLAGGIAHDFNNLLTVINGTADLAVTNLPSDHALREDFEQIHAAGRRAADLTRQLLAFSGRQIMKPVNLDLNALVQGMQTILSRLIGENIALVISPAAVLDKVLADPTQIEQVILNLAINASDAMPNGGTLTIETQNVDAFVMLTVTDTGVGMDEATRLRIFEPFFTTKEQGKGTGLGLSTVDGIVKQSGGSIRAESEVGKGTTLRIFLPRVAEPLPAGQPAPAGATAPTETILLVEDEAALARLTARVLRSAGYTVLVAFNAEDALLMLKDLDRPVDLLLSDVVLPGMSGVELASRLTATHPEVRVLLASGYADDDTLRLGVRNAVAQFIAKPYGLADLTRKVREVLSMPGSARA